MISTDPPHFETLNFAWELVERADSHHHGLLADIAVADGDEDQRGYNEHPAEGQHPLLHGPDLRPQEVFRRGARDRPDGASA
jgi:hypothetical protein